MPGGEVVGGAELVGVVGAFSRMANRVGPWQGTAGVDVDR